MAQKIAVGDFTKNTVLTNLKCDIDETFGLFFSNRPDLSKDNYEKELHMIDLHSQTINKVNLDWVPDDFFFIGDQVLFTKFRSTETNIYKYNHLDNSTELIKVIPFKVKNLSMIDDTFYFTAVLSQSNSLSKADMHIEIPRYKNNVSNIITYLFKTKAHDKVFTLINDKDLDIDQIHFDIDHNVIMYTAFPIGDIKSVASNIYTFDLADGNTTKWTNSNHRIGYIGSLTKDKLLFMGIDLRERSRNDNQDHYIIDKTSGDISLLTEYKDMSNERPGIMTDTCYSTTSPVLVKNGRFYHTTVDRFNETLRSTDADANIEVHSAALNTIDNFVPLKKGTLLIGLNKLNLHELYLLNEDGLKKLSNFNDWLDDYTLSTPIYVDGEIDGWVIPPIDFDTNKKYPGVLMIHGGPKTIYTDVIAHDMQMLAANGYFVFYCNPRGSDGKGNEFSNIRGNFGKYAYEDIMSFVDRVLSIYPEIDNDRLGVTGGSYGGYMTNHIVTMTDRFKAAVSERGISDMTTAFLSSDIGFQYAYEYMGNRDTPWTNKDLYDQASPILNAHRVTTPTLFNHGSSDIRCHYLESLNMYNAILFHGVATKINLYEGQTHRFVVTGKPSCRIKRYSELLNWFDIYLKEEL